MNTHNSKTGVDILIISVFGLGAAALVSLGSVLEMKWLAFICAALFVASVVIVVPGADRFYVLLFLFLFSLPIKLSFHPLKVEEYVFRPISGFAIQLSDVPFFFMFVTWFLRQVMGDRRPVRLFPAVTIPFLILFGLTIASTLMAQEPETIKFSALFMEFECWLIFLFIANNLDDPKLLVFAAAALLSSLVLQSLLGFGQYITGGRLGLELFGEYESSFLQDLAGNTLFGRIGGTLGHPNRLARYLGLVMPIGLALLFAPIDKRRKYLLIVPILVMAGTAELLTFSRGGWLGVFFGGTVVLYLCLVRLIKRKVISLILLACMLIVFGGLIFGSFSSVRNRLLKDDYGAAEDRIPMNLVALNMIQANPLLGVGLTNYVAVSNYYDISPSAITYRFPYPVHNEFLLIAAETGIPSLVLFLFIYFYCMFLLARVARAKESSVTVYLAIGLFGGLITWGVHDMFDFLYATINVTFWTFLGLAVAIDQAQKRMVAAGSAHGENDLQARPGNVG